MLKRGMGWLGWTEEQTLKTTIPAIELAFEGRREMLEVIFRAPSGGDQVAQEPLGPPMTPALFRAVFAGKRE